MLNVGETVAFVDGIDGSEETLLMGLHFFYQLQILLVDLLRKEVLHLAKLLRLGLHVFIK